MRNVETQTIIKSCCITPEQFQLYGNDYDSQIAAIEVNRAIKEHFNNPALSDGDKINNVMKVMKQYSNLGFYDSEPIHVVESLLESLKPHKKPWER